jgi:transcriptional regulator with XRE-family HTH domain
MKKTLGIGPRIKQWRKEKGLQNQQLSKLIKISQGSLSDIENEKSAPSAATIVGFIKHTDINVYWMLTGKDGDIKEGSFASVQKDPPFVINLTDEMKSVLIKRQD